MNIENQPKTICHKERSIKTKQKIVEGSKTGLSALYSGERKAKLRVHGLNEVQSWTVGFVKRLNALGGKEMWELLEMKIQDPT